MGLLGSWSISRVFVFRGLGVGMEMAVRELNGGTIVDCDLERMLIK